MYTYQEEPHRSRRKAIIEKHPEVLKLTGPEPLTKWVILFVCAVQYTATYFMAKQPFWSVQTFVVAYLVGATCVSNLFLAVHELSHNLVFKKPVHNKLFSVLSNLPIGIPYAAGFGPYHLLHHKHQGDDRYDTDLPTPLEAAVLSNVAGKAFFATFQLLFYALRPVFLVKLDFTWLHALNFAVQIAVDVLVRRAWGWNALYYQFLSAFLAGSLHPIAGHFIAEHYVLEPPSKYDLHGTELPETYSYYGPLNFLVYNAGYHNEHHDFPYVPWTRLDALNKLAPEFYDPLPKHYSWIRVIWNFVLDPNVTLWCRVKRNDSKKMDQLETK